MIIYGEQTLVIVPHSLPPSYHFRYPYHTAFVKPDFRQSVGNQPIPTFSHFSHSSQTSRFSHPSPKNHHFFSSSMIISRALQRAAFSTSSARRFFELIPLAVIEIIRASARLSVPPALREYCSVVACHTWEISLTPQLRRNPPRQNNLFYSSTILLFTIKNVCN